MGFGSCLGHNWASGCGKASKRGASGAGDGGVPLVTLIHGEHCYNDSGDSATVVSTTLLRTNSS